MLWGLTDGSAGMMSQVEGVLELLGRPYEIKTCFREWPLGHLPVWWNWGAAKKLTPNSSPLNPPWPKAVISSGRRSAAIAIDIKRQSGGKTKLIHLTDPRICRDQFDLIIAMVHDSAPEAENIIETEFALHRLSDEKLAKAAEKWRPTFERYANPRIAVLIGGTTQRYNFNHEAAVDLASLLNDLVGGSGGSMLVTTSGRTGYNNTKLLQDSLPKSDNIYFHRVVTTSKNPYLGMLALADIIAVTNDSVNMMSEACFTEKPVYILPLRGHRGTKPANFAEKLVQKNMARIYAPGTALESWEYSYPREGDKVKNAIEKVLGSV